jgi:hypothetical protein
MARASKRFVLPYEAEYTAHRTDGQVCRMIILHLHQREQILSPPLAADLIDSDQPEVVRERQE